MKANTIDEILSPILNRFQKDNFDRKNVSDKPPLRSELFSTEQMEQHAQQIAQNHTLSEQDGPELLLKRLAENEDILFRVTTLLHDSVRDKKVITPASEWLLDNFYLIEEQIRIGKRYLPKGYSKGLPRLAKGSSAGFPRVYDIAIQIISHSDGRVDIHSLSSFISAYQKMSYLTIGELWAIPIMLRLALLENLSRVAARIAVDRNDADLAGEWGDKVVQTAEEKPKDLVLVIADMARSNPPMVSAFVAEFTRKLQWKGLDLALPLTWIEQHLAETSTTINLMVLAENQKQAADQLSMSNSINSLRFLAKMDWREFVEAMSIVERVLHEDPAHVYATMDFHTRDTYRHAVEKMAKHGSSSEPEVAQVAVDLARKNAEVDGSEVRKSHVGYYLIGKGTEQTGKIVSVKSTPLEKFFRFFYKHAAGLYKIGGILISIGITGALLDKAHTDGVTGTTLVFIGILSALLGSHFAIALVNWVATLFIMPKPLPKLDFSKGIPKAYATLVVIPTIISGKDQAQKLLDDLEVRFLANRDPNLVFGLLTDFKDANEASLPEDDILLRLVRRGIEELNAKYGRIENDTFFLFHRARQWNEKEKVWMGYERKRGKLGTLNQLLRGKAQGGFSLIIGESKIYENIKYVITLDTDTQLPREAAWKLAGLMGHPLNAPVYDETKKRITEGYGIIQPRIAISLHGATISRYTKMYENDSGIDPYTRVTSDVYQDVFGEGSFIGKGIYDVDAFEKTLNNRFPENRILSHDLLEGSYARCGFASDVQFYEEYPSRYSMDIARRHRWIRGDWQIGNWFLPLVPNVNNRLHKNPVSGLSRWKIFDNLRRSIIPVALFAFTILIWLLLSDVWFWMLCITGIVLLPSVIISIWNVLRKPPEIANAQHFNNAINATYKNFLQTSFMLVCLPYEAFVSLDAICRTLWRMIVTGKKLLEWNPSGLIQKREESIRDTYSTMWFAPVSALATTALLFYYRPEHLFIALPVILAWVISPALVWWLSKPLPSAKTKITKDQARYLRELARKTWGYFENLVGPSDNWLPPDNLQQYPIPVVAHRTSPTNIGLALLSNLSAHDFGYITTTGLLNRCAETLNTMEKLDRYQGHFYNWYDTQTLQVLNPRYISTVDSGNLAGHLLTLRQGLLGLKSQPFIEDKLLRGLQDTLRIVARYEKGEHSPLKSLETEMSETSWPTLFTLSELGAYIEKLSTNFLPVLESGTGQRSAECSNWMHSFHRQLKDITDEIHYFGTWLKLPPVPERLSTIAVTKGIPSLKELAGIDKKLKLQVEDLRLTEVSAGETEWLSTLEDALQSASIRARERLASMDTLAQQCLDLSDMEYAFLYDKSQHLLSIGFNVDTHYLDTSYYDLLASEARLSSFVAIAQGKIPQENWFALGRRLTTADNTPVLLSWSGSMFEYLMPCLIMPSYENTLLDETYKGTVKRQIEYGKQQNIPWGISESCYNIVDTGLTYQYRAFGVPGLGFKRGLGLDLVVAPYATILALMVDPQVACSNLEKLKEAGYEGNYGFFESIDYTPSRLPRGQSHVVIQTFMVHHQGMSLLSLAYLLLGQPMQKRFEADVQFQTALLLLQEQVPKTTGYYSASTEMEDITPVSSHSQIRILHTPHTPSPDVQLLSNGRYHIMMTNSGGGYSRWKETAVTRWREDTTLDNWGSFCYIRDLDSNEFWSNTYQPTRKESSTYTTIFSQGRVEFRRRDNEIETYTEVIVSPEDDIEIRRIHLTNRSKTKRHLDLTSYAEVVLAMPMADASHPAFGNLFVQTELVPHQHAILCTRRPRSKDETPPWMFHLMKVNNRSEQVCSFETDRNSFIGRGHTLAHPGVMDTRNPLSGSQGSVLDPIVSIRHNVSLDQDETVVIDILTGIADTRGEGQYLIDKYQDRHLRDRAFELSWTHSQVVLRQINASEEDAELYGRLASAVIYMNPLLRASASVLTKNLRGQSALWSYSISGDLPIVLLQVSDNSNITLVKQLIQAQAYWALKGLAADLVILNEDPSGYRQVLQDQIQGLIAAGIGMNANDRQGRIFIRPVDQVSTEDLILLKAVARVIIADSRGTLQDQVNRRLTTKANIPYLTPGSIYLEQKDLLQPPQPLQFHNGVGGFSADGKEYVIQTVGDKMPPLPWSNIIANRNFGMVVTESGPTYTWAENAHGFRLTPWNNDPVTDASGEAYYLRDEDNGIFWSVTPNPTRRNSRYTIRHGFGYSTFECYFDGIQTETTFFVDLEAPIKFVVVKVTNMSGRQRKLSATGYAEWVLGDLRSKSAMHVATEIDISTGALMAKNSYNAEFPGRVAFLDVDDPHYDFTGDRTEFIGRNGSLEEPDAMKRTKLSGKSGAGLDPCGAIRVAIDLPPGATREVTFRMGSGKNRPEAESIVRQFRGSKTPSQVLEKVKAYWLDTLGSIQIETPDQALNILTNGWLLYQVTACRLWGRTGFYQSGGAFGFRDQLQDVIALLHSKPQIARAQILLAASRQFWEGDAQHWWHPPSGRGVRTRCSDDYLWLPYVTMRYMDTTGDVDILKEEVSFIEGRLLNALEESYYDLPLVSEKKASLYTHCKRAVQHGLRFGDHGLPLIGSGDWNDGMNLVGIDGKGESIWLGFFLFDVLQRFIKMAMLCEDHDFVTVCQQNADALKKNLNNHGWDGNWYRRAYFDDGTPLGSSSNTECKIDSIAQSWSVLSGAGQADRSRTAMNAVDQYLVNREKELLQLLEPPFDRSDVDPGYIKGYVPGVRENGGQYTHAAIWMVMAFAKLGNATQTWDLLKMINPINHSTDPEKVSVYKVEPYVMAADVYGVHPHTGRGGWTWYTGSAGWMYQLIIESFLGLKREGNVLTIDPCVPADWTTYSVRYRYHETEYEITVIQADSGPHTTVELDGVYQEGSTLTLADDKVVHRVIIRKVRSDENAGMTRQLAADQLKK